MNTPISLLVCALGGEGGGVLSEWLMASARLAGLSAQSTSIPGVAQRTGATTYYIEIWPTPLSSTNGSAPVFSLNPVPGALDALVSTELLETVRQMAHGLVSPDRTRVFSSSARSLTTLERMPLGDGRWSSEPLLRVVQQYAHQSQVWDFSAMAQSHGTLVSAILLGVIAGSGLFPIERRHFEAAIGNGRHSEASLRGFAAAFAKTQSQDALQTMLSDDPLQPSVSTLENASTTPSSTEAMRDWPEAVCEWAQLGVARLRDYQGPSYAKLYLQRLQTVIDAARASDTQGLHGDATAREVARWLALWMAFDDLVRVADLKSRASRTARVAREVKQQPGELLRVYEHFKPGVPELAGLLPNRLAQPLLRWDVARQARGLAPLAWPIKLGSHSVSGMLALRLLASLRWLRPYSSRHAQEQQDMSMWLDHVVRGLKEDASLGLELALCGRLIKGYGSTHARARRNLQHILQHLSTPAFDPDPKTRAHAVRQAREAALKDEAGQALDQQLAAMGAPKRPLVAQPLRFVRSATRPHNATSP